MTFSESTSYQGEIAAIQVRLNWRGRPIIQISRRMYRKYLFVEKPERRGLSVWMDAGRDDAIELAQFIAGFRTS